MGTRAGTEFRRAGTPRGIGLLTAAAVIASGLAVVAVPPRATQADIPIPTVYDMIVQTTDDFVGTNGFCSLREAIRNANTDSQLGSVDCPAGSGTDTIYVPAGIYTLTVPNQIANADENSASWGDLDIRSNINIVGAGADVTIIQAGATPGSGIDRVFDIAAPATSVLIAGVTIRHGRIAHAVNNFPNRGGGIKIDSVATAIVDSVVTANTAVSINLWGSEGGGIYQTGAATLHVLRSEISGNASFWSGGGIYSNGGQLVLVNSTVSGNYIQESVRTGGGIFVQGGAFNPSAIIRNSTIAENDQVPSTPGAAIARNGGNPIDIQNSIITGNASFGNGAHGGCAGAVTGSNNLVDDATCGAANPVTGFDPVLALNGGTTRTHAIGATSNAVDAGTGGCLDEAGAPLTVDQRGLARPAGAACDIGAYEYDAGVTGHTFVAASGDWNVPANWNPATVPGPGQTATIPSGKVAQVTDAQQVERIDVDGQLQIAATGSLRLDGGTLRSIVQGGGVLDVQGRLELPAGSIVDVFSTTGLTLGASAEVEVGINGPSTDEANYGGIDAVVAPTLSGRLTANISGYTPTLTDRYPALKWAASEGIQGNFDAYTTGALDVVVEPGEVTLQLIDGKVRSDQTGNTGFGRAVDVDGDWAAIGEATPGGGRVSILHLVGGEWTVAQTINVDGPVQSVAIDGNDLAFMYPGGFGDTVEIHRRDTEAGAFYWRGAFAGTQGGPVAIDDRYLLIGESDDSVAVRRLDDPNSWFFPYVATLHPAGGAAVPSYGDALAMDGRRVVVGAPDAGTAYTYLVPETGSFATHISPIDTLQSPDGSSDQRFGSAVALQGDTLVVGQQLYSVPDLHQGGAWVYRGEFGAYGAPVVLTGSDSGVADQFGSSVALDGGLLVVGAPVAQRFNRPWRDGAVYVFEETDTGWSETASIRPTDGGAFKDFGRALGLDTGRLVVGAPDDLNSNGPSAGAIYTYGLDETVSLSFDLTLAPGSPTTVPVAPAGIAVNRFDRNLIEGRGTSRLAAASITSIGPADTSLASISIGSTPLSAIVLESPPLAGIPLVKIRVEGGWERILAGSVLEDEPVNTLTFGKVLLDTTAAGKVAALPLSAINLAGTPLSAIPLSAIALGSTPLSAIPLSAIGGDWCDVVATIVPNCGPTDLDDLNLMEITLRGVPLSAIPLSVIPLSAIDLQASPLSAIPLSAIDLRKSPLSAIPLSAIPLSAIGVDSTPLSAIPLSAIPLSAIPLSAIPLSAIPLSAIPLSAITTSIPLSAIPLSAIDVNGAPLSAIQLQSAPLSAIPLSAIMLADAPLSAIPLSAIGPTDWCATLAGTGFDCTNGVDPATTTLRELSVRGVPLSAIPLSAIPLSAIPLSAIPLSAIPLSAIPLSAIPLSAIPLSAIPLSAISVSGTPLSAIPLSAIDVLGTPLSAIPLSAIGLTGRGTLGEAYRRGTLPPGITLGQIQQGTDGIRLGDLARAFSGFTAAQLAAAVAGSGQTVDLTTDDVTLGDLPPALYGGVLLGDLGEALTGATFADLTQAILDPATGRPRAGLSTTLRQAVDALNQTLGDLDRLGDVTLGDLTKDGLPLTVQHIEPLLGFITVQAFQNATGASLPLGNLQLGDLGGRDLGRMTLADLAQAAGGIQLGELLAVLGAEGLLQGLTLGDLLRALVSPDSLAHRGMKFERVDVAALPTGTVATTDFRATFSTASFATRPVDVRIALPGTASYQQGTATLVARRGGTVTTTPIEPKQTGGALSFTLSAVPGTIYEVTFGVLPTLRTTGTALAGTARVVGTDVMASATASVGVVDGLEPNDFTTAAETTPIQPDKVYLSYVTTPTDVDVFQIDLAANDQLVVQLANLDADLDMVLWRRPPGGLDAALSPTGNEQRLTPIVDPDDPQRLAEPLHDFVRLDQVDPSLELVQVANRPGTDDETLSTDRLPAGTYLVQVYGANGATTTEPASLQAKVIASDDLPECRSIDPLPFVSNLPTAPTVPADADTLILVNESRLEQLHGAAARADVADALDDLVTYLAAHPELGVHPVVVPVDAYSSVRNAYGTWDANPCAPVAANAVVRAINSTIVDPLRGQLRHVVILGGDELIPMARLADRTKIANEYEYRHELDGRMIGFPDGINSLTASFWSSSILSDEPYGEAAARSLGDRHLYVTDVALGRVVETPDDIVRSLRTFVDFGGTLDIDTAAVLGYDFLIDGSEQVADELRAAQLPVDDVLAGGVNAQNEPWTRGDATAALTAAGTNALVSLNAHFDHYRALPAEGDKVPGFADNLVAETVASTLGPDALARSLVFSMGCHSGLSVSDVLIGTTQLDWAQTLGELGALYVGNTGFGYGDTKTVAYTEHLMALFASHVTNPYLVDGSSSTVGEALTWAKNEYVAGLQTFSVYDEKALMESTFYGLPFYKVGGTIPVHPLPPPPIRTATPDATGTPSSTAIVSTGNTSRSTGAGTYYRTLDAAGNEQVIVAPGMPIQPKTVQDVTVSGQVARGAMVFDMSSTYVGLPDPVVATPIFDSAEMQPEPEVGAVAFPAKPVSITTSTGPEGQRQQLVLATGQYRSDNGGVQRLDDDMDVVVYYADPSETDAEPPTIRRVQSVAVDGLLTLTVDAGDGPDGTGVDRLYVLVAQNPGSGTVEWTGVDLAPTPDGRWVGSLVLDPDTTDVEYLVQAKDTAGNVGFATNKARNFTDTATPTPPAPPADALSVDVDPAGPSGWHTGGVDVRVVAASSPATYRVDGADLGPIAAGGSFTIAGDGVHLWSVTTAAGHTVTGVVRIDGDGAPRVTIGRPADGGEYPLGEGRIDVLCRDASLQSCLLTLDGAPVDNGAPLPTTVGTHVLVANATDALGNQNTATSTFEIVPLDNDAPVVTPVVTPTPNAEGWNNTPVTVTWLVDDPTANVPPPVDVTGEGADQVVVSEPSCDEWGNCAVGAVTVSIDTTPPTTTSDAMAGWSSTDVWVTLEPYDLLSTTTHYRIDDGPVQSGTMALVIGTGVHTLTFWSVDVAGNAEEAQTVTVRIDTTAPAITSTVTPTPNAAGWNNTTPVMVTFACNAPSGISSCTAPAVLSGQGESEVTGTAQSNSGATTYVAALVKIDITPPAITLTYTSGAVQCTPTDTLSGVVGGCALSTPVALGGGQYRVTATATDAAGNTGTAGLDYTPMGDRAAVATIIGQLSTIPLPGKDAKTRDKAIDNLQKALNPLWWNGDGTAPGTGTAKKPNKLNGKKVFDEFQSAVKGLLTINDPAVADLTIQLMALTRAWAVDAIDEAISDGAAPTKVAKAQAELTQGDQRAAADRADAVNQYRKAWETATRA